MLPQPQLLFFPPSEFIFITVDNWNIRSHWWLFYLPWISQIFPRSTFRLEKALWYCSKIKQRDFNVKSKVWHLTSCCLENSQVEAASFYFPERYGHVGRRPMNARVWGHQNIRLSLPNRSDWANLVSSNKTGQVVSCYRWHYRNCPMTEE